jgi:hypothetical protein
VDHVVEPVSAPERRVAPSGWRRGVVGVALGVVAGALVATVIERDQAPGRYLLTSARPQPSGGD